MVLQADRLLTFPTALGGLAGTQLNNGATTLSTPNVAPDFIGKIAIEPTSRVHFEFGGVVREFKVWNSSPAPSGTSFSKTGGGGFVNFNVEVFKGLRLLTNNFWADGGGRYIFGQVPDLIVRADDSISPIKAASTVSGFEFTHKNSFFYGYFGGIYVYRNLALDTNGTSIIGLWGAGLVEPEPHDCGGDYRIQPDHLERREMGSGQPHGPILLPSRNPWATVNPSDAHLNRSS